MNRNDDSNLRDRFQLLKSQDRALAPEFARLLEALRRPPQPGGGWMLNYRLAGAALALLLLAGFAVKSLLHRPERAQVAIAEISHWRAPTESLLQIPGVELLRTLPQFGENFPTSEIQ
jgi:hypothetical protein